MRRRLLGWPPAGAFRRPLRLSTAARALLVAGAVGLLAGCGGNREEMKKRVSEMQDEITRLQGQQDLLGDRLAGLEAQLRAQGAPAAPRPPGRQRADRAAAAQGDPPEPRRPVRGGPSFGSGSERRRLARPRRPGEPTGHSRPGAPDDEDRERRRRSDELGGGRRARGAPSLPRRARPRTIGAIRGGGRRPGRLPRASWRPPPRRQRPLLAAASASTPAANTPLHRLTSPRCSSVIPMETRSRTPS